MTGDWIDEQGHHVMHERTYWRRWPTGHREIATLAKVLWALKEPPSTSYWINDVIYKDKALAEQEAKQHGFFAEEEFYCDPADPSWFPIFRDWDKALAFLKVKTGITYESI